MQLASLRATKAVLLVCLALAAVAWLTRPAAPDEPPPGSVIELCESLSREIEAEERLLTSLLATFIRRLAEASTVHDARDPAVISATIWLRERIAELEAARERARACKPEPAPEGRLWLLTDRR
jgi:hypothetical protein